MIISGHSLEYIVRLLRDCAAKRLRRKTPFNDNISLLVQFINNKLIERQIQFFSLHIELDWTFSRYIAWRRMVPLNAPIGRTTKSKAKYEIIDTKMSQVYFIERYVRNLLSIDNELGAQKWSRIIHLQYPGLGDPR